MVRQQESLPQGNVTSSRKSGSGWSRFPRERAGLVRLRAISPRARLVLAAIFDFVDEAGVCWPSTELIAERAGLTQRRVLPKPGERVRYPAVDRALHELRDAGLVAWELIEPRNGLPNGTRTRTKHRVLRVRIAAVQEATGTALARRDQNDPFEGINLIPSDPPVANTQDPEIAAESETPDPLNCDLLVKTLTEQQPQEPHPPPREVVVVRSSTEGETVFRAWLERVWRWRFGDVPPLDEERRVRGAIERRMRDDQVTQAQLLDALEGARISPFCSGQVTGREVWGAGIFGGCLSRLIALGVEVRRREQRKATLARAQPAPERTGTNPRTTQAFAAMLPTGVREKVLADLESPSELPSEHEAAPGSRAR